jgi:hypothetical protein
MGGPGGWGGGMPLPDAAAIVAPQDGQKDASSDTSLPQLGQNDIFPHLSFHWPRAFTVTVKAAGIRIACNIGSAAGAL